MTTTTTTRIKCRVADKHVQPGIYRVDDKGWGYPSLIASLHRSGDEDPSAMDAAIEMARAIGGTIVLPDPMGGAAVVSFGRAPTAATLRYIAEVYVY